MIDLLPLSALVTAGDQRYEGVVADVMVEASAAKADDAMVEREPDDFEGAEEAEADGEGEREPVSGSAHVDDADESEAVIVPRRALLRREEDDDCDEDDGGDDVDVRT
jgi:hypothetical protein